MAQYRKKPDVIEAITFDELVAHGLANGANVVNGMPWSFEYAGRPVTHEDDNCYLIDLRDGRSVRLERGEMLIATPEGDLGSCPPDLFAATYDPA